MSNDVSAYVQRSSSSGLADVLDVLLDKGLVLDVFLRVSLIGIELLTIDARVVLASVDTYLRFADAVNRLDLGSAESEGLPELLQTAPQRVARATGRGVVEGAKEALLG
jgi:gas vesicle structural protein